MIDINGKIAVSEDELVFKFSRSGGPGGQNVNKLNTKVTLLFDVQNCGSFSDEQKRRILRRLATRADKTGIIRVISQKYRTQKANRTAAIERSCELLRNALEKRPVRKKTKIPQAAKERRLQEKKRRSILKKQRTFSADDY